MGDSIDDFVSRLCTLCYKLTTLTCPCDIEIRDQVFFDGWLTFLKSLNLPARNPALNLVKQFVVDVLVPFKLRIKKYNEELIQQYCLDISPMLEKWPTLSEEYLARLAFWLVNDINFRIILAIEYSLELDPEIVDHVMGRGNRRISILNKAKAEFNGNCEFFLKHMKEQPMPHYLLYALMDEDLKVPSSRKLAFIKADIRYCQALIKQMSRNKSI